MYGWICPCCLSCSSKQSGDVKNDDVTSGSISQGQKHHNPKNKTLGGKELTKQSKIVYHDKSYSFETDFG